MMTPGQLTPMACYFLFAFELVAHSLAFDPAMAFKTSGAGVDTFEPNSSSFTCLQEMTIAILICRLDARGKRSVTEEMGDQTPKIRQKRDHLSDFRRDCCRNSVNGRPKMQCRPTRLCPERLGLIAGSS